MYKASGRANTGLYDNQPALVGAFSVITNLRMELFEALNATDLSMGCSMAEKMVAPRKR